MEYPYFVQFIVSYYEWMEQEGYAYHYISNSLNFQDVDRTSLELLNIFGRNFLQPLPDVIYDQNNIATLVKYISQYYSARGSEKSFQFLFRLFENTSSPDPTEFYYPSYDMLRVSDGKWINEKSIKIIDPPDDVLTWEGGQIIGQWSGAKSIIDEIKTYSLPSGTDVAELYLLEFDVVNTPEKFQLGETFDGVRLDETTFSSETEPVFHSVNITSSGQFYDTNQRIRVISSSGEEARVVVDYVSKGVVSDFTILEAGVDYAVGERVYTDGDDFGSGAYGNVTAVDGSGGITEITMIFEGHDYQHAKKVLVDTLNGSGAELMMESEDIGGVETVEIRDFGLDYDPLDTTLIFNTVIRVYNLSRDMEIGERITGQTSFAIGIVEAWDRYTNVVSVKMESGAFLVGEEILGERYGGTADIYDLYLAEGELVEGCLCSYKGRYIGMDGHISSLKYIQDSYFYQMFSYMLKTDEDKEDWVDYVKHVHPAGTIGFSYRDVINNYFFESYGGFICPHLDTTEFYKFRWQPEQYHGGHIRYEANTQIKQYLHIPIDDILNINTNIIDKTGYAFGSEITIT